MVRKFKAGDRVEALQRWHGWFEKGEVLTIDHVYPDGDVRLVVGSMQGAFKPSDRGGLFRLVPEDPKTAPPTDASTQPSELISALDFLESVKLALQSKNRKYGNSVFAPTRVFSKADAAEQIRVRIDDKLTRIRASGLAFEDEDTLLDLVGYLACLAGVRDSK